ncbi:MAG: hypothetical protein HQM08_25465 [Candidatus Riflebacteria bacterium]|nr:hypothetical protein [Candidatus Riflebacteria bacterium]
MKKFNKSFRGMTLIELILGIAILISILGIVGDWFFTQRKLQARFLKISEIRENTRMAYSRMFDELRFARQILWPKITPGDRIRSDSVLIFKNLKSQIICYYHVPETQEIGRCVIYYDAGDPFIDPNPIGKEIASATFSAIGSEQKLVSIHLSTEGVHQIDAIRLEND